MATTMVKGLHPYLTAIRCHDTLDAPCCAPCAAGEPCSSAGLADLTLKGGFARLAAGVGIAVGLYYVVLKPLIRSHARR